MLLDTFATFTAALAAILGRDSARVFNHNEKIMQAALAYARHDGLWLEFGVFQGNTIQKLASAHGDVVYGFDSFLGLPEDWRTSVSRGFDEAYTLKGSFSLKGVPPKRGKNVQYVKGWFNDTLPDFLQHHEEMVRFLHVDCDLYSSSSYVLRELAPRLTNGTVVVFDELINYPGYERHELLALWEFLLRNKFDIRILSGGRMHTNPRHDLVGQGVAVQLLTRSAAFPSVA
tara:strand:+ start:5282 stop:5971 length:690 start_codon:yes stop_codon:yes gene_type:complete